MSAPTSLPPLKKKHILLEVTVCSSLSSQQDLDFDMANEPFLDSFSQQGESIELRQRAMAHCTESSTLSLLTMEENITLGETQDTLIGEHLVDDND